MHDLAIIGGGAAGLAAAAYALEKQLDLVLIAEEPGGKAGTRQTLRRPDGEEFLAGAAVVDALARDVAARNTPTLNDRVLQIQRDHTTFLIETQLHGVQQARTVIVATGASPVRMDVPGARALVNHGIGYSASTHAHLLVGKTVLVIGATERALTGALELARFASTVYVIVGGPADMGTPLARTLGTLSNVTIFSGAKVDGIGGSGAVEHVLVTVDGEQARLQADAVFADLGLLPNSVAVRGIAALDSRGFIVVDERGATNVPGLYAAGDVTIAPGEHALIAVGAGARAAAAAYAYLVAHPDNAQPESAD